MKIGIVHSFYSSRQSSGENVVVDAQVTALREHGHDVLLVSARTDDLEAKAGYKVRSAATVASGRGASPLVALGNFSPDIVHVHNLFPNWGTDWLQDWHGPVVASVHNFRPVCAAGTLFREGALCTLCPDEGTVHAVKNKCYRGSMVASLPLAIRNRNGVAGDRLLQRADVVVLLSERARGLYEGFGLAEEKISVIPNFVDDIGFTPGSPPGKDWVFIGRLTEEKGIMNLVNSWPDTESLSVYGDGPLRAELELRRRPNVRFHGNIDHMEVPRILAASRGLVFPSEWAEGFPLVYAEGLASGRAVVAKSGNSAADDVALAGTGSVFRTWSGLGAALKEVAASQELLGPRARQHYDSSFTRSVWLEKIVSVYEMAISQTSL